MTDDLVKRLKDNAKTRASRYHDMDKEDFITWEAAAYIEELEGEKEKLSYRIAFPDVSEKVQAVVDAARELAKIDTNATDPPPQSPQGARQMTPEERAQNILNLLQVQETVQDAIDFLINHVTEAVAEAMPGDYYEGLDEGIKIGRAAEKERCAKLMEHFGAAEAAAIRAKGEKE